MSYLSSYSNRNYADNIEGMCGDDLITPRSTDQQEFLQWSQDKGLFTFIQLKCFLLVVRHFSHYFCPLRFLSILQNDFGFFSCSFQAPYLKMFHYASVWLNSAVWVGSSVFSLRCDGTCSHRSIWFLNDLQEDAQRHKRAYLCTYTEWHIAAGQSHECKRAAWRTSSWSDLWVHTPAGNSTQCSHNPYTIQDLADWDQGKMAQFNGIKIMQRFW